jgi:type I restriction enzyme S subunit
MSSEGFKETEIGLIPEGWKLKAFSDIVDIIGGGTPKTTMEEYWEGEIPWLSVVDFNNEFRTVNETEKSITEMGLNNSSTKILKKGELIISARGTVGAIAQLGRDMAFNQSCYGLRAMKTMTDNDFIYYLLKYSLNILKQTTHGSTFDTITKNTFDLLKVPLPPMKEQIKIASILSVLDDKIELNHRMNQTLEAIGQAIFRHWFVHFEFPNSEGQPYRSSGGEMVDSELGEIPKGWKIKPLDKIANYLNGLALQKYPPEDDEYLPVVKIRELKQGIAKQTDKTSRHIPEEYIIDDGDIIFSWSGSLEVVIWGEGKGALNQHLFKVSSEQFPKWFYYYQTLRFLPSFRQTAADKATTMGHIKRQHLTESLVSVPNKEVLSIADMVLKPIIEQIINNKIQSRCLKSLRDSLLPKLMSGKIRVYTPEEATVK